MRGNRCVGHCGLWCETSESLVFIIRKGAQNDVDGDTKKAEVT